ncbi:MAG: hypothetical protein AB7E31_14855, partial [Desulfitobacterium sp.]
MATTTTNYELTKPDAVTEYYDVAVPNANMDIIDQELKDNADAVTALAGVGNTTTVAALDTTLGEHLAENATLIDAVNTNNYVFSTGKNITLENLKIYTFRCSNSSTD